MSPERLNAWIYKVVPGGTRLQLVHEHSLTGGLTVASWAREQVDEARENPMPGQTIGDQVIEAANEHANNVGDSCKFVVQWTSGDGAPLRSMHHRAASDGSGPNVEQLPSAAGLGALQLQAQQQLLGHIAQQQKVINGSIGVVLTAFERAMAMQQRMIETLGARLEALPPPNDDSQNEQVTMLKIRALEKFAELGPDVTRLAIAAVGRAIGAEPPPPPDPNGVS
jgi:hypothetical protein